MDSSSFEGDENPSDQQHSGHRVEAWVPITDVHPDAARQQARSWLQQFQHLNKRLVIATAESKDCAGCEALKALRDVWEEQDACTKGLQRLKSKLHQEVQEVQLRTDSVLSLLAHTRRDSAYVDQLAHAIDAADQALTSFRSRQCSALQAMQHQQEKLESELEALASRLEAGWEDEASQGQPSTSAATGPRATSALRPSRPLSAGARPRSAGRKRSEGGGLDPAVQAYEEFVEEHGETGGWDPEDHAEFLGILKACKGDYTHAVALVLERSIGFTKQEVVAHARWHMDLVDLEARKRLALARWRDQKETQRAKLLAQRAAVDNDTAQQAQRERQRDQSSAASMQAEVAVKREMVAQWKAMRQEQQRQAAEAGRRQAEARAQEQAARAQRQQMLKEQVELAKAAKEQAMREAQRRAAAEAAIKTALTTPTPQQRERVAQRNSATFNRRLSLVASKEEARAQRGRVQQQLLEKVHVEAPADPKRLLKGTEAHMRRLEEKRAEERHAKDSGFILHTSKRIVPNWRAGLAGM